LASSKNGGEQGRGGEAVTDIRADENEDARRLCRRKCKK